jgi:SNF2 family DNA or RNA helicase
MKFKIGDEVQCISDPSRIGVVIEIGPDQAGMQWYRVNFGGAQRSMMPEQDLRSFKPVARPCENLEAGILDGYAEFQRLMTYQRLLRDFPLRNNIYAFNASRTRFYPYQFKPLLKFLDSPRHRLLVADEVGLGKTIEAGLILTELRARQTVQRVLVVCPANLTQKWQIELRRRFGEDFEILKANDFMEFLREYEEHPEDTTLNGIISLESIRRESVREQLESLAPGFDLVVVDEAHHMRNPTSQRAAGVMLSENTDAMLLLTATPVHLGNQNLYSLLNILDSDDFPDFPSADARFRMNEPIVSAQICLGHVPANVAEAEEFLRPLVDYNVVGGNPLYSQLMQKIESMATAIPDLERRRLLVRSQRDLANLNLLGHILTRTRKREVHALFPVRNAFPIRLRFTEQEQRFYDAVTQYVRLECEQRGTSPVVQKWILNMPQRRLASSIPAMVTYYRDQFGIDEGDRPEDVEFETGYDPEEGAELGLESARMRLRETVRRWPEQGPDTKYAKFREILTGLRSREGRLKVMVFAFFKGTLSYLQGRLTRDGFNCAVISGDISPADRVPIVQRFREDSHFEILLSSRVGSEGLDFEFCDVMFNYDLPWNPMEIEQRIGRLDRLGQQSLKIRIYNFWIEGTIEQRILERLYNRIAVFERSIGELEMILGEELSTLQTDILSKTLSPREEEILLENRLRNIERRMKDLERLEKQAAEFLGTDYFFNEEVEAIRDRRRYITGEQMRRFVEDFLRIKCPGTRLTYDPVQNEGRIFPDKELRGFLQQHRESGDFLRFFSGAGDGVPITFDSQTAFDNPRIEFINVLHPISQAIARFYGESKQANSNAHHVVLITKSLPPGFYLYFVYRLRIEGAKGSNTLETVILNEELDLACGDDSCESILGEMVEKGQEAGGGRYEISPEGAKEASERALQVFLERIESLRGETERNNAMFIDRRIESVRSFYQRKIQSKERVLREGIQKARQERYLRMLEGTIRRLSSEQEAKLTELDRLRRVTVGYDEIAAGILEVP